MISNYIKIILRSFQKNLIYNALNMAGLSIGFATVLLIIIYIVYETSFDRFHKQGESIYRLTVHYTSNTGYDTHFARVDADWTTSIPDEIPEVKKLIRFQNHEPKYVRIGNEKFTPENAFSTDGNVFEVFNFSLIQGDPKSALVEPFSVVISKSLAIKYFGNEDILGNELIITRYWTIDEEVYKITGIMDDLPSNTHMPVDMLVSFRNEEERRWWAYTYMLMNEGADIDSIISKIENLMVKNEGEESRKGTSYSLQNLYDIHLHSDKAREIQPNGNILYVRVFAGVAVFVLLIAMINFMNLSNVIALGRAKEIGLRKVMGSGQRQLVTYSLTESIGHCIVAAIIACLLVYAVFPSFRNMIGVENNVPFYLIVLGMGILALLSGMLSGFYTAFVLTSFEPAIILKSNATVSLTRGPHRLDRRKMLVTGQFTICILLTGSAFIARQQFVYLNEKNLGLEKEQVLALTAVPDMVKDKFILFKNELVGKPGILGVSACLEVPSREIRDGGNVTYDGMTIPLEEAPTMDIQVIDHDFVDVMGLELVAGNSLPMSLTYDPVPELNSPESINDYLMSKRRAYIINETAMHKMGWTNPAEAIGKNISWSNGSMTLDKGPVVGVVKDFHQETLKNTVDPVIMVFEPLWLRTFLVKLQTQQINNSIVAIEETWNRLFPQYPFEYVFLDELYESLYKNERRQIQLLYSLSGLAIFIAFLGLFGLVAFTLKTRTKEIAVRKIFGANFWSLLTLFSKEYALVTAIAAVIAIPASYYMVSEWLTAYAYRVSISWVYYAFTIFLVLFLSIATISYHTFKGASANPIDSLRQD